MAEPHRLWDEIEYISDGEGDYLDDMMTRHVVRDRELRGAVLASAWSRGRRKREEPVEVVIDLLEIRDVVHSLIRIHGIPEGTQISVASLGEGVRGASGFEDLTTFEKPWVLLDKSIYDGCDSDEMLDVYCGIGLHEASHLNHTREFFTRCLDGRLRGERKIWENLFEDERIEEKVREESPGYSSYLHAVKRALFEKKEFGHVLGKWGAASDLDKIMLIIFAFIRCPYTLTDRHKEWVDIKGRCVYEELRELFPIVPATEAGVAACGKVLMDWWGKRKSEYTDLGGKTVEEVMAGEGEPGEGKSGEGKSGDVKPDHKRYLDIKSRLAKQKKADEADKKHGEMLEKFESALDAVQKELARGAKTLEELSKKLKDDERAEDRIKAIYKKRDAIIKRMDKLFKDRFGKRFSIIDLMKMMERHSGITEPLDVDESKELAKATDERLTMLEDWDNPDDGRSRYDSVGKRRCLVIHPKPTAAAKAKYNAAYTAVRGHVRRMRSIFQLRLGVRTYQQSELSEGRLHRRMIGKAVTTHRIFRRSYTKKDQGLAICLLLDESGSMGSCSSTRFMGRTGKASTCFMVSVLMAEALKGLPGIELEIYSYSSCGSDDQDCLIKYLYGKQNPSMFGLAGYGGGHQNYDHMAIKVAGDLFVANTENQNRLMIVLNDGAPAGTDYGGPKAVAATRQSVEDLTKRGMSVLNVAIESFRSEAMFKNVVRFLDLQDLINRMRRLVVRVVKQTTEARV